jgi:hypothetical protein
VVACRQYEVQKREHVETRERARETDEASITWLAVATAVRLLAATACTIHVSLGNRSPSLPRRTHTNDAGIPAGRAGRQAAKEAGNVIREAFYQPKTVTHKGSVDLVTEPDKSCEALLKRIISKGAPDA